MGTKSERLKSWKRMKLKKKRLVQVDPIYRCLNIFFKKILFDMLSY